MLSRTAALLALVALTTLLAANSAHAQQLKMPSDPLAGTVIKSDGPSPSAVQLTPGGANVVPSGGDISMSNGSMSNGAPSSMYSSGAAYNPTLGAHIRATYTTQSYGQEAGQLSLGTMKLFQGTDGMSFIDGQVTMNDESNVGYNLGIGYRWMTLPIFPFSPDAQKIAGVSLWSDGLSKGDGTFFPQIGGSLELLGEHLDLRANGYLPLGEETQTRDFFQTGVLTYSGNNLATQLQGVADTSLTVGEIELAGRIANYDAWVFGGGYGFDGGAFNGGGGKVGLRGYATPDLMVSVAIANDNEFDTNTLVNLTWFIGRTRAENCPRGELSDRFREPVIRNNYVALQQSTVFAAGGPLLDADGTPFSIVHVDNTAAPGGDGTFENPLNSLNTILANSQTGDIVLAHGGSVFTGQSAVLQNEQIFLGEGGNNPFTVTQFGGRMFTLPETAPGALAGPVPQINNSINAGVVLADNNTVRNLSFSGGVNAITSDLVNGSHNSTLRDLTIANTTGNAINLVAVAGADEYDVDNDDNTTETVNLLGTVVIDDVDFSGSGGNDIAVTGGSALAGTKIAEVINITDVTSTGSTAGPSIAISNTVNVTGSATNITNYSYNGGAAGLGGILLTDTGAAVVVTESDFTGGDGPAVDINGSTGTVTVGSTNTIDDITNEAVRIVGNTAAVNIGAEIDTDAAISGGGVSVDANEGIVSFTGAITANNFDAVVLNNAMANVTFGTAADIVHTGTGRAMVITDAGSNTTNTTQVTVNGDITNSGGRAVEIDGGDGGITFAGVINDTGAGISIVDRADVNTALTVFNGQTTLTTGANDALTLTNNGAASVTSFTNLDITTTGAGRGIIANNGGTLNIAAGNGNTISTQTGRAIDITGGSSGNGLIFQTVNVNGADQAIKLNDFNGTVTVNGGTMTTTGITVEVQNSNLVMDEVILNSTTANDVISATVTGTTSRTITLTDIDANGDDVDFRTNVGATGALTVSINNDESANDATGEIGSVTFSSNGSGNSSLTLTDVRTDAGFDYDVNGAGNLSTTMTNVTSSGNGNTTLDVTSTGDALLTMSNVNTGGAITATSTGASDGDMVVSVTNSGNTEAFTNIQVNDQGDGVATTTLTNVSSTGGVDFDSAGDGAASLTVAGGTYGGAGINSAATNNGTFATTISGTTNVTAGGVTVNAQNTGAATVTMSGATNITAGNVAITATNIGNLTTTLSGVNAAAGSLAIAKTTTGNATYSLSNLTLDGASINSANTGTISFMMQGVTSTTTGATDAVSLVVGPNVTTGDVDFFGTNNFTAVGGSALDVDIQGGDVDFRVANGTFENNSATEQTVAISVGGTAVADTTVTGNTARNTNAGSPVEFLIETLAGGSPQLNLNLSGNTASESGGGSGSGQILVDENAGTVRVFELTDTFNNVGNRNNATVTFDPNNIANFDNLASPPSLPFQ